MKLILIEQFGDNRSIGIFESNITIDSTSRLLSGRNPLKWIDLQTIS